jgi:hypothetical protein
MKLAWSISQLLAAAENGACLRSFLPIDLYKSTRHEWLNLYRCALTLDAWPTQVSGDGATALMKILSQRGIPLLLD